MWSKPQGVTQVVWHCKGGDRSKGCKGCKGRTGRKASELFQTDILVALSLVTNGCCFCWGSSMKQLKIYKNDVGKDSSLHFCPWVSGKGWEFTDIWYFERISDRSFSWLVMARIRGAMGLLLVLGNPSILHGTIGQVQVKPTFPFPVLAISSLHFSYRQKQWFRDLASENNLTIPDIIPCSCFEDFWLPLFLFDGIDCVIVAATVSMLDLGSNL